MRRLLLLMTAVALHIVTCQAAANASAGEHTEEPTATISLEEDNRYFWSAWSRWHCNCPAGSMSRIRDVTYMEKNVTLSEGDFHRKRFQRLVCDYHECKCSRPKKQCIKAVAECPEPEVYLCALRDMHHGLEGSTSFWRLFQKVVRNLWARLMDAFQKKS
ncbi:hypothetical protein FKM82_016260 [Ascaphus truei]